jgi:hypothetical protein
MSQVLSHRLPAVRAGEDVQIKVGQTLGAADRLNLQGPDTVHVHIEGPQTALTADLIAGVYPAPGSETSPDLFLPHIAFNRRTLPWERRGPTPQTPIDDRRMPWLALLVVSEEDLRPPLLRRQVAPTLTLTKTTAAQVQGLDGQHLQNTLGIPGETPISTLTLSRALLSDILPTRDELPLLCHVKRDDAGVEHSIVVASRLPDATAPEGERAPLHYALLVSVERWDRLWQGSGNRTLLVLHHWTFRPVGGGDFEQVVKSIRFRPNGGVQRFGNVPGNVDAGEGGSLSGGFGSLLHPNGTFITPLEHDQDVAATYRGPIRPFGPQPLSSAFAIAAAPGEFEGAPPGTPLEYSHAAAFELGRLLALADPGILEDLRGVQGTAKSAWEPPAEVNQLPDALQWPDWVSNPQWYETPWSLAGQSLVKDEAQLIANGKADTTGVLDHFGAAALTDIVDAVTDIGPAVMDPAVQLDLGALTEAQLGIVFADVAQAEQG